MREACLNRSYTDLTVHLVECSDPDEGRRKCTRLPECDGVGPIVATPLRVVGSGGTSGPSHAREGAAERSAKRAMQGTSKRVECSQSSSHPREIAMHPLQRRHAKGGRACRDESDRGGGGASSFGIVSLPLKVSSNDNTSSHVYGRGSEDTCAAPPTPRGAISRYRDSFFTSMCV